MKPLSLPSSSSMQFPSSSVHTLLSVDQTPRATTLGASRRGAPTPLWMRAIVQIGSWIGQTNRAVGFTIRWSLSNLARDTASKVSEKALTESRAALEAALNLKVYLDKESCIIVKNTISSTLDALNPGLSNMVALEKGLIAGDKDKFTWAIFREVLEDRIRTTRNCFIESKALEVAGYIASLENVKNLPSHEQLLKNADFCVCFFELDEELKLHQADKHAYPLKFEEIKERLNKSDMAYQKMFRSRIEAISDLKVDQSPQQAVQRNRLVDLCASIKEAL